MEELKSLNAIVDQMQDELTAKITKLKAITAIYEKAHRDVATIMGSNNLKMLPHNEVVSLAKGEKFRFDPMPTTDQLPNPNKQKRKYNRVAENGGESIAAKTREFMDKYFKSQEEFTMDTLVKRVQGLIPTANFNNVANAYTMYLKRVEPGKKKVWEQTFRTDIVGTTRQRFIILTEKQEENS